MPAVNGVGKPGAGEPHARIDGRELETERVLVKALGVEQPVGKPQEWKAPRPKIRFMPPRQLPTLLTHICGKNKAGRFWVRRITIAKRMRAKLAEVKTEIKRRRHHPIPEQARWLASVLRGHYAYYGVPGNSDATQGFRFQVIGHWRRALRLRRSAQLGDIPRPHLVRRGGDQLRLDRGRVGRLAAPLPGLIGSAQQPVERRDRSEVDALVEERGPHLGRREVDEALAVQHVQDRLLLLLSQRPRLWPVAVRDGRGPFGYWALSVPAVVAGLRGADRVAGCPHTDLRRQLGDRDVGHLLDPFSGAAPSEIVSKSACSFACTSTTKRVGFQNPVMACDQRFQAAGA
jgi:hypothetical protein